MTTHAGSAVWIDHHEARILRVAEEIFSESIVEAPHRHVHHHPKGSTQEHRHPEDMRHFFADVTTALDGAEKILILGPSTAKLQFLRYLRDHASAVEPHVVGIETADHPTDRELLAHIRHYFGIVDRVR
jgi:stalled ribosome rescue protein Dom34